MMTNDIKEKYETLKSMCESTLETVVPSGIPVKLASAMRYALLGGGKRLRPVLYLAVLGSYGKAPSDADLKVAAAIECIHSYSLVHDDLPAMDGDLMRRGKPSVHVAYGEAEALLAGDALLNLSFSLLAECACYGGHYAHIMKLVADRCGRHDRRSGFGVRNGSSHGGCRKVDRNSRSQNRDADGSRRGERLHSCGEGRRSRLVAGVCA